MLFRSANFAHATRSRRLQETREIPSPACPAGSKWPQKIRKLRFREAYFHRESRNRSFRIFWGHLDPAGHAGLGISRVSCSLRDRVARPKLAYLSIFFFSEVIAANRRFPMGERPRAAGGSRQTHRYPRLLIEAKATSKVTAKKPESPPKKEPLAMVTARGRRGCPCYASA